MGLLGKLFRRKDTVAEALWAEVVARGREPHWYLDGAVPDTIDGRFDMIASVLTLVLLRIEVLPGGEALAARLTERFVDDMDGQLRQIGIGDMIVGKHVGKMMGSLGGRLGAFRDGLCDGDLDPAIRRNVYRGEEPGTAALAHVRQGLLALHDALRRVDLAALAAGRIA